MPECHEIINRFLVKDPEVLRKAAQDAGDLGCHVAVPGLITLLQNPNLGVQEAAELALRQLGGPETVQGLCQLLRIEDAQGRNLAMDILREIGNQDISTILALLSDNDADIRIFAADILGATRSILAVPPLCRSLIHDTEVNVRHQAAVSLGCLGFPEAVPYLNQALNDNEWVQFSVIEALLKVRDDSSINVLIRAMPQASDLVASMIVEALGEMGNLQSIPLLLKRLETSPRALRNKIIRAVVLIMGEKNLTLLPAQEQVNFREYLLSALEDEDEEIQDAAISGLASLRVTEAVRPIIALVARLDPDSVIHEDRLETIAVALAKIGSTEPLREALQEGDPTALSLAIQTLRRLPGLDASKLLMESFWIHDRDVQRQLVDALCIVAGDEAEVFFHDLLIGHGDGHVLKQTLHFLSRKSSQGQIKSGLVDRLLVLLDHPFPDVRMAALEACTRIGDPSLVDTFMRMSASPSPEKRAMAIHALGSLGRERDWDVIQTALEDESPKVRKAAIEASVNLCGMTAEIIERLRSRLWDEDRDVRLTLVNLLGHTMGVIDVIPVLKSALNDSDDWVQIRAIEALGRWRRSEFVKDLTPLLQENNPLVALKVIEALGMIGGQAAFQILLGQFNSDDPERINAVENAITELQGHEAR